MNSVIGVFCDLEMLAETLPGASISVMNDFNAILASAFIYMGYISAKKFPLENTLENIFPYKVFFGCLLCHMTTSFPATYYVTFCLLPENWVSHCDVLFSVYFACSIQICHILLRYYGDTDECCPFGWNISSCGTYFNSITT